MPASTPGRQGLYDPAHEHDACGVGAVANVRGEQSHGIVRDALHVLHNLDHRGAAGSAPTTGDGAGILVQVPDAFLRAVAPAPLPAPGRYAVGTAFLPTDEALARAAREAIDALAAQEGLRTP
ncbi:MAG: Glutamate synthase [NADPH] large chain, partial [uncultured Actinomycetospora sp.]